jgi:hypothetical protein
MGTLAVRLLAPEARGVARPGVVIEHMGFLAGPRDQDEDKGHDLTEAPERRLWRAVIARALRDAAGRAGYSAGDPRRRQHEALSWLFDGPADFRLVCTLAGLGVRAVHLGGAQAVARILVARAGRRRALLDRLTSPLRPRQISWRRMD